MSLDQYTTLINEVEKSIINCNSKTINFVDDNHYPKYPDMFFVLLTIRLLTAIESSIILLKAAKHNSLHLLSIGNILRSGILDSLHFYYLLGFFDSEIENNNDQTKLIEEIKRINCNQIYYLINDTKFILNNSEQEITHEHLDYFNSCKECFSDGKIDLELNNKIKAYTEKLGAKDLIKNTNKEYLKNAMALFELYCLYSKYDHYGEYTSKIIDNNNSFKLNEQVHDIFYCIQDFFLIISFSSSFCFTKDESRYNSVKLECIAVSNKITELIQKISPNF